MIATGVKPKPPKFFQVLEFIGHQETSSGCGLMGLGEKMLSQLRTAHAHAQSLFLAVKPVTPVLFISYTLEL